MNGCFLSHMVSLQTASALSKIHATVPLVGGGPIAPAESTADLASGSVLFSRPGFTWSHRLLFLLIRLIAASKFA
jgi:hypothetical protein